MIKPSSVIFYNWKHLAEGLAHVAAITENVMFMSRSWIISLTEICKMSSSIVIITHANTFRAQLIKWKMESPFTNLILTNDIDWHSSRFHCQYQTIDPRRSELSTSNIWQIVTLHLVLIVRIFSVIVKCIAREIMPLKVKADVSFCDLLTASRMLTTIYMMLANIKLHSSSVRHLKALTWKCIV